MIRAGLAEGSLAWVDPAAELIILQDGLEPATEHEVIRQAMAGMFGDWRHAPDTRPASRDVQVRPQLRLLPGGRDDDTGELEAG